MTKWSGGLRIIRCLRASTARNVVPAFALAISIFGACVQQFSPTNLVAVGNRGVQATEVTGILPHDRSGSATVFVLGIPDLSGARLGQRFSLPVLAAGEFRTGIGFQLMISAAHGTSTVGRSTQFINAEIVAISKVGVSVAFVPVAWRPGDGSVARVGRLGSFSKSLLQATAAADHMSASRFASLRTLRCTGTVVGHKTAATRVGELHVAAGKVHGSFTYAGKADSVITVGRRTGNRWATNGNVIISNSGLGGTVTVKKATNSYIETKFDFDLVHFTNGCTGYAQMAVKWDGAPPNLGGKAPPSPYRSCHADPHGFVAVPPRGNAEFSGYKAVDYSTGAAAGFQGYSFGASSGYSKAVHPSWTNSGTADTFLCGSSGRKTQEKWLIIYNQNH